MSALKIGPISKSKHLSPDYTIQIRKAINDGLNQVGRLGVLLAKQRAPEGATKLYKRGIQYVLRPNNLGLVIFVGGPGGVYAEFVEFGRSPGKFPPPNEINFWLRKSRQGRKIVSNIKRQFKIKKRSTALNSATYLVSRKIAQKGTEGKFVFTQVENILEDAAPFIIQKRLNKVL